jgi:hypothetical protein
LQRPLEAAVERVVRVWLTLALVSVGVFATALDNSIVNVALPSIQRDLRLGLPPPPRLSTATYSTRLRGRLQPRRDRGSRARSRGGRHTLVTIHETPPASSAPDPPAVLPAAGAA